VRHLNPCFFPALAPLFIEKGVPYILMSEGRGFTAHDDVFARKRIVFFLLICYNPIQMIRVIQDTTEERGLLFAVAISHVLLQIAAASFALRSPYQKSVILCDEAGTGKSHEATLVDDSINKNTELAFQSNFIFISNLFPFGGIDITSANKDRKDKSGGKRQKHDKYCVEACA